MGTVEIKARLSGTVDAGSFESEIEGVLSPWTLAHWTLVGVGLLGAVGLAGLGLRRRSPTQTPDPSVG